jgi:uncharacterized membrane protein YhaH (DUF805 family)
MDFGYLLTSFEGRINRQPYWLASLALIVVMVIIWLLAAFFIEGLLASGSTAQALMQIVFLVIIGYPATALMVKRLHDRNQPGILAAIFWAPSIVQIIGQLLGVTGEVTDVGGTAVYLPNTLGWIISLIGLGIAIWALVVLGFLRGTQGPNNYGPDPLGGH